MIERGEIASHCAATIYLLGHSVLHRHGVRLILEQELKRNVAVESDYAPTNVWNAMRSAPHLAIADADAATPAVRDALQMIPRLNTQTRLLVLSVAFEATAIQPWAQIRLDGYVLKDGGVADLAAAIDSLLAGRSYFSAGIEQALMCHQRPAAGALSLTRREAELLPLLARGMSLRQAAERMAVSYKTADSHRTNLLRKLGVRDRVELARYAIRENIVEP
ncbi:MAG: response regulator transcription factor [Phycisphaerales bacterium]|nr:response regulator transcription factor [Phycisphaerales bacterium]